MRARLSAPVAGLGPDERGILLHRALKAFWDDVRDHATLAALADDALVARIETAVARGAHGARLRSAGARCRRPWPRRRARGWRPRCTAGSTTVERERPPFTVAATEASAQLALGGLVLSFRIDRVDALADGGAAIIDYKSGRVPAPSKWFAARPSGTQVGLYALARKDAAPDAPLRAAAYAQLKAGDVAVAGLAADAAAWPALRTPADARNVNLDDVGGRRAVLARPLRCAGGGVSRGRRGGAAARRAGVPVLRPAAGVPRAGARRRAARVRGRRA